MTPAGRFFFPPQTKIFVLPQSEVPITGVCLRFELIWWALCVRCAIFLSPFLDGHPVHDDGVGDLDLLLHGGRAPDGRPLDGSLVGHLAVRSDDAVWAHLRKEPTAAKRDERQASGHARAFTHAFSSVAFTWHRSDMTADGWTAGSSNSFGALKVRWDTLKRSQSGTEKIPLKKKLL